MVDELLEQGPWYVYHRDDDGQESDQIFYDFAAATRRYEELHEEGWFQALTLTTSPTPLGEYEEEEEEVSYGGCLIFVILIFAVLLAVMGYWGRG